MWFLSEHTFRITIEKNYYIKVKLIILNPMNEKT